MNNNMFAKAINVNPVVTHNIISGRLTKPSYELLEKILLTFDNINADWLICGRGEMFVGQSAPLRAPANTDKAAQAAAVTTIEILREQLLEVNHVNRELLKLLTTCPEIG